MPLARARESATARCASTEDHQAPSLPLFREQEGQPRLLPVPFFSIPDELHILLPVPSVGCYSRGGHVAILDFRYRLTFVRYGYTLTASHLYD